MKKLGLVLIVLIVSCKAMAQTGSNGEAFLSEILSGKIYFTDKKVLADSLAWNPHASFKGVYLKHLFTGADTGNGISLHIVKIDPGCVLDTHVHEGKTEIHEVIAGSGTFILDGKEMEYTTGNVSVIPANTPHKVIAGAQGLYIVATFTPSLL